MPEKHNQRNFAKNNDPNSGILFLKGVTVIEVKKRCFTLKSVPGMSLVKREKDGNTLRSMFNDLLDSNSFFGSDLSHFRNLFSANLPAANVKETDTQFEIELAVPGFSKGDFKIDIDDEVLHISAEKKEESKEEKGNFTRREFNYNSFERSFSLPQSVDQEGIKAEYKEGLLQLVIPKKEVSQKKIKKEITVG